MKKLLTLTTSCAVLSLMAVAPANAQSMDYTSLQELFGEPVTTSATGKPQRVSEAPVTMEIVTQDDIRRSGATNVAEALRQVNGVNVVQKTAESYDVAIRGYNQHNSQRLLVLVNGRQVYLDHYGYTDWQSIPVQMEEIRQIEVVKGPNTALFGFNAVNGVVNIVTYNPMYDDESSAGITVGTSDYRKAHYVQSLKLNDKIATRISGSIMRENDFNNDVNGAPSLETGATTASYDDPKSESLSTDTMFQVTDNSQLRMEIAGNRNRQGSIVSAGQLMDGKYETKSGKLSYVIDSDLGLIKANVYKNFMDWEGRLGPLTGKFSNEVLVGQLEDTIELNANHTIRLQTEYRDNSLNSVTFMHPDAEISYNVYAGGGMWDWKINDKWTWNNAARVDHLRLDHNGIFTNAYYTADDYDQAITEFSYNSGLVWKATDKDTVRLNTGRGLEVPALVEYGLEVALGPLTVVGDPRLKTAVVTNYELAWDHKVDPINGLFRSSVFYNDTKDVKVVGGLETSMFNNFSDNIGDSSSYGIELALEGKFANHFDWGLGYIYQNIDDDLENGKTATTLEASKEFEDSNPKHQINAKLGYKNGPWEADGMLYYVSSTEQFYAPAGALNYAIEEIDNYVGANARVAYTFDGDVTLALSGQQLLRSQTQTSVTPDVDRRLFLSLSKKF